MPVSNPANYPLKGSLSLHLEVGSTLALWDVCREKGQMLDWFKTIYGAIGAQYPILSQVVATCLGAIIFGGGWWAVARAYQKDHGQEDIVGAAEPVTVQNNATQSGRDTYNIQGPVSIHQNVGNPALDRPYVTIASMQFVINRTPSRIEPDQRGVLILALKNGGRAIARQCKVKSSFLLTNLDAPPEYRYPTEGANLQRTTIAIGAGDPMNYEIGLQPLSLEQVAEIRTGRQNIFVFGEISYRDLDDQERITTFSCKYDSRDDLWKFADEHNDAR